MMLFGGLSMLLGLYPTWGSVCLTVFLVPATLIMHNFWADRDPSRSQLHQLSEERGAP